MLELTGFQLSASQAQAFKRYQELLLEWNTIHNLTAIRLPDEILVKHFLDSLSCYLAMQDSPSERIIDVGTGAGFPGLVLKILYPHIDLTLVESVQKKMDFCRLVVDELVLEGVSFLQTRVEEVGQMPEHREKYDWAVARAVANLPVLSEYLLPLLHRNGIMVAMKGETAPAEAHTAEYAIHILGGHLRRLIPITLPGVAEQRFLVIVDKVATTPAIYPRKPGIPNKRPILKKNQTKKSTA